MRVKFTDAKVRDLVAQGVNVRDVNASGRVRSKVYRDTVVPGLFVEVSGRTGSYKVQTTARKLGAGAKSVRKTLGRTTDHSIDEARLWALSFLGDLRKGRLPQAEESTPTVRSLYERYAEIRRREGLDETHTKNILGNARLHLSDWLDLFADKITQSMVERRYELILQGRGPYAAKHTMKQLRAVYNAKPGLVNPVHGIRMLTPNRENDAMMPDQLPAWWEAVATVENPIRRNFHKFLLLSGMRKGHLRGTRREWINLDGKFIQYPRLKAGRPFKLPLSPQMMAIVQELLALPINSAWLFPSPESVTGHLMESRESALPAFGHTLRRTYVSIAGKTALPEDYRKALVDHTTAGIHGRYQNLDAILPELIKAQEQISRLLCCNSHDLSETDFVVSAASVP